MKKYSIFGAILVMGLSGVIFASSGSGSVPHVFKPGEGVSSSKFNENFSVAASEREKLCKDLESARNDLELLKEELRQLRGDAGSNGSGVSSNSTSITSISSSLNTLIVNFNELKGNVGCFKRDGLDIILEGKNLVVRDSGIDSGSIVPGVGNIKVGREDTASSSWFSRVYRRSPSRTGSNSVIVGGSHEYTGNGVLMVGALGRASGEGSVVFGCENRTSGRFSSAPGGTNRHASSTFETNFGVPGPGPEHKVKRVVAK